MVLRAELRFTDEVQIDVIFGSISNEVDYIACSRVGVVIWDMKGRGMTDKTMFFGGVEGLNRYNDSPLGDDLLPGEARDSRFPANRFRFNGMWMRECFDFGCGVYRHGA